MQKRLVPCSVTLSYFSDNHDALLDGMLWWLQDRIFPLKVRSEFQMCNTPVAQDSRQISGKLQITPYYLNLVTSVQNRLYAGSRGRMFL